MKQTFSLPTLIALILLLTAGLALRLCAKPEPPGPPRQSSLPEGAVAHRDLAYVPNAHERQKLDLNLPKDIRKPPLILNLQGDQDPLVPHHQSQLLETALKNAGVPVTFTRSKAPATAVSVTPRWPD